MWTVRDEVDLSAKVRRLHPEVARLAGEHDLRADLVHTNLTAGLCACQAVVARPPLRDSGGTCASCGGLTVRTGTCETCTECGTQGGCG
jgi:hypothetical protein